MGAVKAYRSMILARRIRGAGCLQWKHWGPTSSCTTGGLCRVVMMRPDLVVTGGGGALASL